MTPTLCCPHCGTDVYSLVAHRLAQVEEIADEVRRRLDAIERPFPQPRPGEVVDLLEHLRLKVEEAKHDA
jgi:hypothetical protein